MMNIFEDMEKLNAVELNDAEMEAVSGGRDRYIEGDNGKSNVRLGPGLNYKSIGVLHRGEDALYLNKTAVDERGVLWYKVRFGGRDAWVSSRYTCKVSY